jgi:hypothetical protein
VETRQQNPVGASEGNLSQDQYTPKASGRSQKRPRLLFGAPRPANHIKKSSASDESPSASSNETTSTSTTARSILFGGPSRRSFSIKDAGEDSTLSVVEATKLSASQEQDDQESRTGANDDDDDGVLLQSPANKRSSLFGKDLLLLRSPTFSITSAPMPKPRPRLFLRPPSIPTNGRKHH